MTTWDKKIIYLSYDGLTDPLGQSQILPYLIGLSSKGYKFIVVTFEKEIEYTIQKKEIEILCQKHHITWMPLLYHKKPPILSTIYDLWVLRKTVGRILRQSSISIIHCRSYITSLIGLDIKRKTNVKFIFDMRGFWPDERVEGGLWNLKNPFFKMAFLFLKKKERQFLKEADHIISLTENAKNEILSWRLKTAPISVIPTCVDLDLFNPASINKEDQEKLRSRLGILPSDFVLLYLGSWGTWYMTAEMLNLFKELKNYKPNAKFLIVTKDRINLMGYQLKNEVIITSSPRHLVPLHISLCNASVFFIKPSFSKKASSATKMAEILAMTVPIITNPGWGDVEQFKSNSIILVRGSLSENREWRRIFLRSLETSIENEALLTGFSLTSGVRSYHSVYLGLSYGQDIMTNN